MDYLATEARTCNSGCHRYECVNSFSPARKYARVPCTWSSNSINSRNDIIEGCSVPMKFSKPKSNLLAFARKLRGYICTPQNTTKETKFLTHRRVPRAALVVVGPGALHLAVKALERRWRTLTALWRTLWRILRIQPPPPPGRGPQQGRGHGAGHHDGRGPPRCQKYTPKAKRMRRPTNAQTYRGEATLRSLEYI